MSILTLEDLQETTNDMQIDMDTDIEEPSLESIFLGLEAIGVFESIVKKQEATLEAIENNTTNPLAEFTLEDIESNPNKIKEIINNTILTVESYVRLCLSKPINLTDNHSYFKTYINNKKNTYITNEDIDNYPLAMYKLTHEGLIDILTDMGNAVISPIKAIWDTMSSLGTKLMNLFDGSRDKIKEQLIKIRNIDSSRLEELIEEYRKENEKQHMKVTYLNAWLSRYEIDTQNLLADKLENMDGEKLDPNIANYKHDVFFAFPIGKGLIKVLADNDPDREEFIKVNLAIDKVEIRQDTSLSYVKDYYSNGDKIIHLLDDTKLLVSKLSTKNIKYSFYGVKLWAMGPGSPARVMLAEAYPILKKSFMAYKLTKDDVDEMVERYEKTGEWDGPKQVMSGMRRLAYSVDNFVACSKGYISAIEGMLKTLIEINGYIISKGKNSNKEESEY